MCLTKRHSKNVEPKLRTVNIHNYTGTPTKLKRAQYLLAYLQTGDKEYSCRASKLSHHAHERLVSLLAETGDIKDAPRPGRPLVYTEAVMAIAYDRLAGQEEAKLTGAALMKELKAAGQLHESADRKQFMAHLKAYVKSKGHKLLSNCTRTYFGLTAEDAKLRVAHARAMLRLLDDTDLSSFVFSDEVVLESAPHPKGELQTWGVRGVRDHPFWCMAKLCPWCLPCHYQMPVGGQERPVNVETIGEVSLSD